MDIKIILEYQDCLDFWIRQFSVYDELNYKYSAFYVHDYSLFHVERSFQAWKELTAWSVYHAFMTKKNKREFDKVAPPHSIQVDNVCREIKNVCAIMEEIK